MNVQKTGGCFHHCSAKVTFFFQIDVMAEEGVWDSAIKRQNANLIVCMADWIIPGHGQPFRVLPQYRYLHFTV